MNNCLQLTETEWCDLLLNKARETFPHANVLVTGRTAIKNGITRIVRATVVVDINNEKVLNSLIKLSMDYDFEFLVSEANLQGDTEVDYLTFQANIIADLGA